MAARTRTPGRGGAPGSPATDLSHRSAWGEAVRAVSDGLALCGVRGGPKREMGEERDPLEARSVRVFSHRFQAPSHDPLRGLFSHEARPLSAPHEGAHRRGRGETRSGPRALRYREVPRGRVLPSQGVTGMFRDDRHVSTASCGSRTCGTGRGARSTRPRAPPGRPGTGRLSRSLMLLR